MSAPCAPRLLCTPGGPRPAPRNNQAASKARKAARQAVAAIMAAPPPAHPAAFAAAAGKENATAQALREQVVRRVLASNALDPVKVCGARNGSLSVRTANQYGPVVSPTLRFQTPQVQAHLRAALYAELKGGSGGGGAWTGAQPAQAPPSLRHHVLNCLVGEYLLARGHAYSLSVFLAESGSGALPQLGRADLLRLVGVAPGSRLHTLLAGPGAGEACLAEGVVAALGELGGETSTNAVATASSNATAAAAPACKAEGAGQGSSQGGAAPASGSGVLSSTQLAARLQAVEDDYRQRSAQAEAAAAAVLEERVAALQRECEARYAAQLAERLAAAREGEIAAARSAAEEAAARQVETERARLERAHAERLAALAAREEEILERARRQHRELDAAREDALRAGRADEERLRAWRADGEARVAAAQAAARQREQEAEAAARRAELQQQAGEQRLAVVLEAAQQREAAAARAQAAAEVERGRVGALQDQLAGALQELGSLRQQLAAERSVHQGEAARLQGELEALRRASARAADGPSLSPSETARLQRAARRLSQRVDELGGEAEAARQREALWRGAAAEADKLLGKVRRQGVVSARNLLVSRVRVCGRRLRSLEHPAWEQRHVLPPPPPPPLQAAKAQDRALQHAEDLRLALAAAAREVADLQQHAALAAAGAEGAQAAALAAASADAQRWREGSEARVAAARREEERLRQEAAQLQQRVLANRTAASQGLQQLLALYVQGRRQASSSEGETASELGYDSPADQQPLPPAAPAATPATAARAMQPQLAQLGSQLASLQSQLAQLPSQPPAAAGSAAAPPSRTSSQILAAYRARQLQRSSTGGPGAAPSRSRTTSLSQEASCAQDEGSAANGSGASLPAASTGAGEGSAAAACAEGSPVAAAAPSAQEAAAGGDSYYVDGDAFTSEDSRF